MTFHVEGLERHKPSNPHKYTPEELDERKIWLKKLSEQYPDVDPKHREWVYDLCAKTPTDELEKMKERIRNSKPRPPTI